MSIKGSLDTNKNSEILMLNALGILLVVVGHSQGVLPSLQHTLASENILYATFLALIDVIYTFHMPLFFFISGYLFFYTGAGDKDSFFSFLIKKSNRLLLPYFIISSLTYPLKVILSNFALRPVEFGWIDYASTLIIPWNNSIVFFWFLPTLYLIMMIAKLCLCHGDSLKRDVFIMISAVFLFFYFDHKNIAGWQSVLNIGGVLHNFIYFVTGGFLFKYVHIFAFKRRALYLIAPFLILLIFYIYYPGIRKVELFEVAMSFSGILFCFSVIKHLPLSFSVLGKYSYQIYLLSWFPQIFVRVVFGQVFFVNIWISVFLSILAGLVLPIVASNIIERINNKWLSKAFGL